MKIRKLLVFALGTALFIGAAWATVITDYDRHTDFSGYKTYAWGSVETANSLWDQRVRSAIESQLAAKGWKQVESGCDVVVNAAVITRIGQDVHVAASGSGGGPAWGPFANGPAFGDATATKSTYAVGTLIIEIKDAGSMKTVWWSLADDTISANSDKTIKKFHKNVESMFKHFPPGSGKR